MIKTLSTQQFRLLFQLPGLAGPWAVLEVVELAVGQAELVLEQVAAAVVAYQELVRVAFAAAAWVEVVAAAVERSFAAVEEFDSAAAAAVVDSCWDACLAVVAAVVASAEAFRDDFASFDPSEDASDALHSGQAFLDFAFAAAVVGRLKMKFNN